MNWLAHLYLSEPSPQFRIGNLLPDFVPPAEWQATPREFVRGAECHLLIDRYTDSHPVVRESRRRIRSDLRRFSGIVVDLFYDHFLAANWGQYAASRIEDFTSEVYASFEANRNAIPAGAWPHFERIRTHNLLCCYGDRAALADALRRTGNRFRKPVLLAAAMDDLENSYELLRSDFEKFFPELRARLGMA